MGMASTEGLSGKRNIINFCEGIDFTIEDYQCINKTNYYEIYILLKNNGKEIKDLDVYFGETNTYIQASENFTILQNEEKWLKLKNIQTLKNLTELSVYAIFNRESEDYTFCPQNKEKINIICT